jgi:hypothetical protein
MANYSGYPKELPHPCGFKHVVAYDPDEERALQKDFASFRKEHQDAQASSLRGEAIKASSNTLTLGDKK